MSSLGKIRRVVAELLAWRVAKRTAAPLLYRFLWFLRIPIPPPLYQSFIGAMALHGLFFGGILGAVLACSDRRLAPDGATILGTICGAIYGLVMAGHYRIEARRLALPVWEEVSQPWWEHEGEEW